MNTEVLGVILQIVLMVGLAWPLGKYIARVYKGERTYLDFMKPVERLMYKLSGVNPDEEMDWKKELKNSGKTLYRSLRKAIDIPTLLADILQGQMKGQTKANLDLHAGEDVSNLLRRVTRNIVMGLWVMALLISSSIICTTDMKPKFLGIPALGAFGYFIAVIIVFYVFAKHIFSKRK